MVVFVEKLHGELTTLRSPRNKSFFSYYLEIFFFFLVLISLFIGWFILIIESIKNPKIGLIIFICIIFYNLFISKYFLAFLRFLEERNSRKLKSYC